MTVKRAESLKEIYDIFDPTKPLEGEYLDKFYVSLYKSNKRFEKLFEELKRPILESKSNDKFLFGGFKGCGKSTELNRLCEDREIKDNFLIVKFSIKDKLNIADVDYKDLLIVCAAEIYNSAQANNIKINEKIIKVIEDWASQLTIIKTERENKEIEGKGGIGFLLSAIFGKISGWIKFGSEVRKEIRKEIEPKIYELVDHINRMLEEIKRKKDVLLVIEDIDKLPPSDAERLFSDGYLLFSQINCKAIFTFPFALMLSPIWGIISKNFSSSRPVILSNITIHEKEGGDKRVEEGYGVMREIFEKRANRNLIDEDALDEAIKYSGGVVFDFIRIIRNASNHAIVEKKNKIEKDDVNIVVIRMRDEYDFLTDKHIEKLKEVYNKKYLTPSGEDRIAMDLLATLSVLKYYNSEEWFDVHPIIEYKVK